MQRRRSANVGYQPAVLLAIGMVFGAAGRSPAQRSPEPTSVSDEPAIVGCGKAEAMRARFVAEQMEPAQGGVAEAMGETDVLHNDLTIEISNLITTSNTCTITGQNRMTIQSKTDGLTAFTFRLRNQYVITSALVNDTTPVTVTTISNTTRSVTLDRAYGNGEVFTLTIAYTGNSVSLGFGSIQVTTHSGTAVVATLSEPYYAYSWWPAKDGDVGVPGDNSDKATLALTVTTPNNFTVAANGVLQDVQTLSGDRKQYFWSSQYPIVTYLVSFAATNYNTWTKNYVHPGGTMPVQFFIYPENDNPTNRLGWEKATDMMTTFRPLFGEYPFINEKYGIYNFPFGGGMEHQTITGQSGFSEGLTSHELSHQWWGDAVTCKTWSDIWLNEGFATYAECLWEEYKTGVDNPTAYFSAILAHKPGAVGDSVYVYPPQTGDVGRIFSWTYSYLKGAWVLHQLRHVVGDATFFQILADYRAAYEGSAATTDDFTASASATYGQDLTWFIDEWVYQIGAPAYRFGWDSVNVGGQEYLHVKIEQTQVETYPSVFTMPVDIVATINGSPQTLTVWNDARSQRFVLPTSAAPSSVQFDPQQWILRTGVTSATLVIGDMDGDNDVDSADFSLFAGCYTGPGGHASAGCAAGDFDGDGDIDCTDWIGFWTAWTAGGFPPTLDACGTPPGVVVWDSADTSPDRTTRSLRFKVTGAAALNAIKVTMVELQHPNPRNATQFPPPNASSYSTFDTNTNGVCSGATATPNYNGHPCNTTADCLPAAGGTPVCSSLVACTATNESVPPNASGEGGCARWVGKPGTFLESQNDQNAGNYGAARLQCTPFYHDWVTETATQPITVVGAEILPSSTYSVRTYGASCQGSEGSCANVSAPLTMFTRRHGDLASVFNPPATTKQPDATDVSKVVDSFKHLASGLPKAIARIMPNLPEENNDVDTSDISTVVDAFKGFPYKLGGPCPCPSMAACGALACPTGADLVCTDSLLPGLGPEAKCIKTCSNTGEPCLNGKHCGNTCASGPFAGRLCDTASAALDCGTGVVCTVIGTCGTPLCRDKCGRCK